MLPHVFRLISLEILEDPIHQIHNSIDAVLMVISRSHKLHRHDPTSRHTTDLGPTSVHPSMGRAPRRRTTINELLQGPVQRRPRPHSRQQAYEPEGTSRRGVLKGQRPRKEPGKLEPMSPAPWWLCTESPEHAPVGIRLQTRPHDRQRLLWRQASAWCCHGGCCG
jgi:hypothetical protein